MTTEEKLTELASFSDLTKLDLRFGKVLSAERVPKSDKLLKMQVEFGEFQRQIVAGVGKTFEPEKLVDGTFLFIVNLPPRPLMGVESNGMLFATGTPDSLALVMPFGTAAPGSKIG